MNAHKPELIITADGSHTLFIAALDEQYHSLHGAIQESNHVFIDAGLAAIPKKNISILEVGFGTGLNALLTALFAEQHALNIHYTTLEAFPLEDEIVSKLNFAKQLNTSSAGKIQAMIHSCSWEEHVQVRTGFILNKKKIKLEEVNFARCFDLVYFDAFAPRVQPELWTADQFAKIFSAMSSGGILVTYCAKGEVKRTLKSCGFTVQTLQGPPGKNEMVRAVKP